MRLILPPRVVEKVRFTQYKYLVLLDVGLAAPDSLKDACMNLSGVVGEADVPR